ncbi:MAG: hypothetical protein U0574_09040 [Phycisphaerales bacterium]
MKIASLARQLRRPSPRMAASSSTIPTITETKMAVIPRRRRGRSMKIVAPMATPPPIAAMKPVATSCTSTSRPPISAEPTASTTRSASTPKATIWQVRRRDQPSASAPALTR